MATLNSFVGSREIKTTNETKAEIVEGFSLRIQNNILNLPFIKYECCSERDPGSMS